MFLPFSEIFFYIKLAEVRLKRKEVSFIIISIILTFIPYLFSLFPTIENSAEMTIKKGLCSSTIDDVLKNPSARFNGFTTQKEINYCVDYVRDISSRCSSIVPQRNYTKALCYHFCSKFS